MAETAPKKQEEDVEELGSEDTDDEDAGPGDDSDDSPFAVLKGSVTVSDDSRIMWTGKWSMSDDSDGKTAKFKYGGPKGIEKDAKLTAKILNGKYNGYFINEDQKVKEKGVKMVFAAPDGDKSAVSGSGTNEYGTFTIKGTYDQSSNILECNKKYDQDDDEEDDDDALDDAEPAEEGEAEALADEADMPIEELLKRYGGGAHRDAADDEPPAKKQKVESDEEQYDEF